MVPLQMTVESLEYVTSFSQGGMAISLSVLVSRVSLVSFSDAMFSSERGSDQALTIWVSSTFLSSESLTSFSLGILSSEGTAVHSMISWASSNLSSRDFLTSSADGMFSSVAMRRPCSSAHFVMMSRKWEGICPSSVR